jgi:hypothetical protein
MPGPAPKRSDQRRRRNKTEGPELRKGKAQPFVEAPPADPEWDPRATEWYNSLALSGQSVFYEPTDWATAHIGAALLSDIYRSGFARAADIKAWVDINGELLATEGARRRARVELVRDGSETETKPTAPTGSRKRDRALLEVV